MDGWMHSRGKKSPISQPRPRKRKHNATYGWRMGTGAPGRDRDMKFGKKDGLPYLSPPNRYIWSVGGSQMEAACPLFLRPFGCPLFLHRAR